jgi:hypothetical protein
MQTFELLFVAPIPVGHRVELVWHGEPEPGWISSNIKKGSAPIPSKPVLRDLDTGIIYGPLDHFLEQRTGYKISDVRPVEPRPLEQLGVHASVRGRVVECRVLTEQGIGTSSSVQIIQTSLTIEEETGSA